MVFSFFGGRDGTSSPGRDAAAFAALQTVRAYWEGLRGPGGAVPPRSAVDPRGLAPALESVFVAERIGTGLLRLRIAGTAVTELAGIDMKGLPLSAIFLPEARNRLAQVTERLFTLPQTAELHLEAERSIGRPPLAARLLLLPLLSNTNDLTLALGCLVADGQVGRAPRRFGIARCLEEQLVLPEPPPPLPVEGDYFRPLPPLPRVPVPAPALGPGFAEPARPAPLTAAPTQGARRKHPHLRLVHSAD